jgi:hypothetical protein
LADGGRYSVIFRIAVVASSLWETHAPAVAGSAQVRIAEQLNVVSYNEMKMW